MLSLCYSSRRSGCVWLFAECQSLGAGRAGGGNQQVPYSPRGRPAARGPPPIKIPERAACKGNIEHQAATGSVGRWRLAGGRFSQAVTAQRQPAGVRRPVNAADYCTAAATRHPRSWHGRVARRQSSVGTLRLARASLPPARLLAARVQITTTED